MAVIFYSLDEPGWDKLRAQLSERQNNKLIVDNLIGHLRALGTKGYIVEDEYLDKDFTEAFSAYYSRLFKRHSKLCKRFHFFSNDLKAVDDLALPLDVADWIRSLNPAYVGFIVMRPIHEAPLAQAILKHPETSEGYESHVLVKASYKTHLLGAELEICGFPMTQQDSRIGACAQATIWSAARHFHVKHRGPWVSTVDITEAAMRNEVASVSAMLPNGSEFLSMNGMVAALRASGRHPLMYTESSAKIPWRPIDIINRYVDSGIPVILLLQKEGDKRGHAVIASGQIFSRTLPVPSDLDRPSRAVFCAGFYVNDDQRGPNLRMTRFEVDAINETGFGLETDLKALIIPLPDKVYLPAEKAESLAWDLMEYYARSWTGLVEREGDDLGGSVELGNEFAAALKDKSVLARTYLTYGWKYKHRILKNSCADPVKRFAAETDLPRYVWVTEFGTIESFGRPNHEERTIFGHCVIDATAKNMGPEGRLFFHAPGFVHKQVHDLSAPEAAYLGTFTVIGDDRPYKPKIRGR